MYCLIPQSFPPTEGGVETYLLDVCKVLAKKGVSVLAPWHEAHHAFDPVQNFDIQRIHISNDIRFPDLLGGFVDTLKYVQRLGKTGKTLSIQDVREVMKTVSLVDPRYMVYILQVFSRLVQREAESGIDVTHIGTVLPSGVIGLWAKQLFNVPYVPYIHAAELNYWQRFPRGRELVIKTLKESAKIVAVCEYARGQLLALGISEDKIVKIAPGLNPKRFASENGVKDVKEKHRLSDKIVILTLAHLVRRKGHDTVLKALPGLVKEFPDLVYLIVGRGPYRAALEGLARELGVRKHVVFAGYVDNRSLPAYYNVCDIFVMVSREIGWDIEGFGIVNIEASAAGKPVVAGRAGGVGDAVIDGETGLLVNPESHTEVAEALRCLLRSEETRRKLGENGRTRVQKMFSLERVQKDIEELNLGIETRGL